MARKVRCCNRAEYCAPPYPLPSWLGDVLGNVMHKTTSTPCAIGARKRLADAKEERLKKRKKVKLDGELFVAWHWMGSLPLWLIHMVSELAPLWSCR
jgi:hypothetical protein